jgi:hypothetical protein
MRGQNSCAMIAPRSWGNNESGEETLLETNAVLDAINLTRQEMNGRFDRIEVRLTTVEADIAEIKESQFSFDVRLERVQGMCYESLSIGHNLQADVKILCAEVGARAKDLMRLEKQLA